MKTIAIVLITLRVMTSLMWRSATSITRSVMSTVALVVAVILLVFAAVDVCVAQERPLPFLRALVENNYGDMAVEYLKILEKRPELAPEIVEVWDLEMSKALKSAAAEAFDAKEYEQLMDESQKCLGKFIKEKPDHPEAATATAAWGDFLVKRALELIRTAKPLADKEKERHAELLNEARTTLEDAREKFKQAGEKFKQRLAALPPPPKSTPRKPLRDEAAEAREEARGNLREAHFQAALVDYYLAQTITDPKNPDRTTALKKAAKQFDDMWQANRTNVTGVYAHMWHGKCEEELGNFDLALDVYDEVLANQRDPNEKGPNTGLEPLFTQVEHFRLLILAQRKPKEFMNEAAEWLKAYRSLRQTDGYQGIAMEYIKARLAEAKKATGPDRNKRLAEVLQLLSESSRVRSQYQPDFIMLRRELLAEKTGGAETEASTFDEAITLGDAAAGEKKWDKAIDAYDRALDLAEKSKIRDPSRIDAVREAKCRVRFMIARELFDQGKLSECLDTVGKIVRDDEGNVRKDSAASAAASALGVIAALNLYVGAQDEEKKDAALDRLVKVAEFTEKNWPDRPEADDARIARGQAFLVVGKVREAIEIFDRVNPKAERYSKAAYMAGQNYWRLYVTEKTQKDEKSRDEEQMTSDRTKAIGRLSAALAIFGKQVDPAKPLPPNYLEAQLLLAEIRASGGELKEAVELYQPLIEIIKADKPQTLDATTIRIFLGAVRAYAGLGDLDKAGEVGSVLIDLGPDNPQINGVLVNFTKLLNQERKSTEADVINLEGTTKFGALNDASKKLGSIQELLGKMLMKLAPRQEMPVLDMVFIGDTLGVVGLTAEASEQYQKFLKRVETDAEFAKAAAAAKAVTRVRVALIGLLRKDGKFDEAIKQVDKLIKDNPNSLDPLMEKGRILEAQADKNPAKFDEAVTHWAQLRQRLQRLPKKPDEYYDVMYNVAACLMREAEKSKDPAVKMDRAKKAEQVLKSPLILSPKLNGPDTVARYNALVKKAIKLQGRSPDKKDDKAAGTKKPDEKKP